MRDGGEARGFVYTKLLMEFNNFHIFLSTVDRFVPPIRARYKRARILQ